MLARTTLARKSVPKGSAKTETELDPSPHTRSSEIQKSDICSSTRLHRLCPNFGETTFARAWDKRCQNSSEFGDSPCV